MTPIPRLSYLIGYGCLTLFCLACAIALLVVLT